MVFDLHDSLENRRVVFWIGIDFGLDSKVGLGLVHFALDVDDFLEDWEDVAFGVFYRVEEEVAFPQSKS